jgi:glycosyltransferase involved in cell wall biosynthesis
MARQATVSLTMIVRNEGHQLAACLGPVAELFDEIVIVDTGSQDDTREVARRFTSRVIDFPWCDDFSAARNKSLQHATGDWIFWLDADDRIAPRHVQMLRELLDGLSDKPQAFLMQTLLDMDAESRDKQRLATHLRLFRRDPNLKWRRRVHEQLAPWPAALGHAVVFTDIQIEHLGYRDARLSQRKLRRNIRLMRMDYALMPDDPSVLADLGQAYAQLGRSADARHCFKAVLTQPQASSYLRRRAFTTLGELENAEGNYAAADMLLARAGNEFPDDAYLLYMHSEALYNLDRLPEAKAALVRILDQPRGEPQMQIGVPCDIRPRLARLALGEVLRVELALCQAEEILRGVTDDYPLDPTAWFFLGRVYVDWRRWERLEEVVARLADCPGGEVYSNLLVATAQFGQSQWSAAEATLDRLIALAPGMILPRVLRAECLSRRGAAHAAQVQACRDILRLQPQNERGLALLRRLEQPAVAHGADYGGLCTSVVLGEGMPGVVATL